MVDFIEIKKDYNKPENIEVLKSILLHFLDEFYIPAIERLRQTLKNEPYYKDNWKKVVRMILMRELQEGQALYLIHNVANLPIHENSDNEAYKWLTLMIINLENSIGSKIYNYNDFLNPDLNQQNY